MTTNVFLNVKVRWMFNCHMKISLKSLWCYLWKLPHVIIWYLYFPIVKVRWMFNCHMKISLIISLGMSNSPPDFVYI